MSDHDIINLAGIEKDSTIGRFLSHVQDNISCTICQELMFAPCVTPCGHAFCYDCLNSWITKSIRSITCPICRAKMKECPVTNVNLRDIVNGIVDMCEKTDATAYKALKKMQDDHIKLYQQDLDRHGKLFPRFPLKSTAFHDVDGLETVRRCSRCLWEVSGNICANCGAIVAGYDSEEGSSGSDSTENSDDGHNMEDEDGYYDSDAPGFLDDGPIEGSDGSTNSSDSSDNSDNEDNESENVEVVARRYRRVVSLLSDEEEEEEEVMEEANDERPRSNNVQRSRSTIVLDSEDDEEEDEEEGLPRATGRARSRVNEILRELNEEEEEYDGSGFQEEGNQSRFLDEEAEEAGSEESEDEEMSQIDDDMHYGEYSDEEEEERAFTDEGFDGNSGSDQEELDYGSYESDD